jgi:hypothetical protein
MDRLEERGKKIATHHKKILFNVVRLSLVFPGAIDSVGRLPQTF